MYLNCNRIYLASAKLVYVSLAIYCLPCSILSSVYLPASERECVYVCFRYPSANGDPAAMRDLAEQLVRRARDLSLDKHRDSPFAILAKDNDIMWGGGMPDDTTVVVARVVTPAPGTGQGYPHLIYLAHPKLSSLTLHTYIHTYIHTCKQSQTHINPRGRAWQVKAFSAVQF